MQAQIKTGYTPLPYIRFVGEYGEEIILRNNLPTSEFVRWTPRNRRLFVEAVKGKLLTEEELKTKYGTTLEELEADLSPRAVVKNPALKPRFEGVVIPTSGTLSEGIFEIDIDAGVVKVDGDNLHLERRERILLTLLMFRKGEWVTKEQLLGTLQAYGLDPLLSGIDSYVSQSRSKFRAGKTYITLGRGSGFRFMKPPEE